MAEYKFQTEKFALSDKSVHFLRGRFNYDTVDYLLIDELIIEKGPRINNWPVALAIGLALVIGPGCLFAFSISSGEIHNIGMSVEIAILPFVFGLVATYQWLRRGYVLKSK